MAPICESSWGNEALLLVESADEGSGGEVSEQNNILIF